MGWLVSEFAAAALCRPFPFLPTLWVPFKVLVHVVYIIIVLVLLHLKYRLWGETMRRKTQVFVQCVEGYPRVSVWNSFSFVGTTDRTSIETKPEQATRGNHIMYHTAIGLKNV